MGFIKVISELLGKLNCICKSKCCDCEVDITPAEYEEIIRAAIELVEKDKKDNVLDFMEIFK